MLEIKVDPDKEIEKALQRAKAAGINLTLPFTLIAKSWFRANRSIFTLKGPGKYPDLGGLTPKATVSEKSKKTREERAKQQKLMAVGFLYPLMRREGVLEESLTNPAGSNTVNLILNKNTLIMGTKVAYAFYHQAKGSRKKMPFRPIVFTGAEQIAPTEIRNASTRWINTIDDYMQQVLSKAFNGTPSGAV